MSDALKIGYLCPDEDGLALPDSMLTAEKARDLVNSRGGVHGREIELVAGTDGGDPTRAAALAREWVDAGVLSITGTSTAWGDEPLGIMANAGVSFTGAAIDIAAYMHPASRPFIGGAAAELILLSHTAADLADGGSIGVVHSDMELALGAVEMLVRTPLRQRGMENVEAVAATDGYDAAVAGFTEPPAVIMGLCEASDAPAILRGAAAGAPDATTLFTGACLDEVRLFDEAGELAEGCVFTAAFWPYTDTSHDQVAEFRTTMGNEFRPSAFAQGGFAAIMTLADVFERVGPDLDAAKVHEYLDTTTDQPVYMQTHLSKDKASPLFPSLYNLDTLVLRRVGDHFEHVNGTWRTPPGIV